MKKKLKKVEECCKNNEEWSKERQVITKSLDVRNEEEMKNYIDEMDKKYPIDLVIANAGVNISTLRDIYYTNSFKEMIGTNVIGVMNTILPMITNWQERKTVGGHIAIMGDMQSYSSISFNGPYAASKSALRCIADDLRAQCKYWNVKVTYVAPHQVDTKMCKENRINENVLSVEQASRHIVNGLYNDEPFIMFPSKEFLRSYLKGTIHPYIQRLFADDKVTQEYAFLHTGRRFEAFKDNDPWH